VTDILAGTDKSAQITQGKLWNEITSLVHRPDRIRFIDQHNDLLRHEVVSELTASIPRLVSSETGKALPVAEVALVIARRLRHPESVAKGLRGKANALCGLGRNKSAISYHRKAIELFSQLNDSEQVARTLSSTIQPLIFQGCYDQALSAAREAQSIFERQGNHWRAARVKLNLGNIYQRQDRPEDALRCYEGAYDSFVCEGDAEGITAAVHNMALSHLELNHYGRAMAGFQVALALALNHDIPVYRGLADYNLGRLHYLTGDYYRALSMLKSARETCVAKEDLYHVALCNLDLSEVYLNLNMNSEASEAAELATASFRKLGMRYETAKAMTNMAIARGKEGNAREALGLFLRARRMFVDENNPAFPAIIDFYRAEVLVRSGRKTEPRKLCTTAITVFRKLKLATRTIESHLLLARLLIEDDLLSAEKHCRRAVRILRRVESPDLNCHAYTLMGQIQKSMGNENRSCKAYEHARCSLDKLRDSIHVEELKIAFMKDRVQIYQALVAHCMRHQRQPKETVKAFKYIQEAKSRSLLEYISTSREASCPAPHMETVFNGTIQELRTELNWFYHKIDSAKLRQSSRKEVSALQTELRCREQELLRLSREHSYDRGDVPSWSPALTVDLIRQAVPRGVIILEYFQIDDRIVVLLLSEDLLEIVPVADCLGITSELRGLDYQLSKVHLGPEYGRIFAGVLLKSVRRHLQGLYRMLIEPIRQRLHGRQLVIAPHGVLHRMPFQALFNGHEYLIDEFAISYAPSASVYAFCRMRSTRRTGKSLVMGIPDQTTPYFQEEVRSVASCLPNAEILLGSNATVERLRETGRESQFIHVATHGQFRLDNPAFSRIELGGSYLSLYDLYHLQLPAELITLSGCSTGLNVVAAGDELLGLARGLIHAGAETSLLTLWDVQDHSAAKIMTMFYRRLRGGETKPEALQYAMQRMRPEYPHPYHWAPFNLVGKG
jgi:tetratricopeptide (TPR) repeat protein